MAHIDFKVTAWERVHIPDELLEQTLEKIKSGSIQTSNDLFCFICEDMHNEASCEFIDGAEEQISPEENDGQSTLEVYTESGKDPIYTNATKKA